MTLQKRWKIAPAAPVEMLRGGHGLSPVMAQVLYNRGFTTLDEAVNFLASASPENGRFLSLKRSGAVSSNIDRAILRINQAIRRREPIIVYGDFDADGVTSTVLMVKALRALEADAHPYIPHRVDEGYGLNSEALRRFAAAGVKLVVTVDCGIRSIAEAEDARAAGLDLIITDHHSLGDELPPAYAVLNPKCDDLHYSEPMLAGVGVAYRLAEALLTVGRKNRRANGLQPEDLLDLVAIGTVADLVPLNSPENRALVRTGLERINTAPRAGVAALIEVAGMKPGQITAQQIGYGLGPRINAAGRLESAMIAYHLLETDDREAAIEHAMHLQTLNTLRQELTRAAQESVRAQLEDVDLTETPLIFASGEFQPGIVGLVAGKLAEEYFRPAVVMEQGETESRGSCRSIPQFDITAALDEMADLFVRHGGHAQAAGFTIPNENIPIFKTRLMAIARDWLAGQELLPTLDIDAEVDGAALSMALAEELMLLEPTGHSSAQPVLATRGLRVMDARAVGREGQHLKLRLWRPHGPPLDAIGFNMAELRPQQDQHVDVAYSLEINEWNGSRSIQLNLYDVQPGER